MIIMSYMYCFHCSMTKFNIDSGIFESNFFTISGIDIDRSYRPTACWTWNDVAVGGSSTISLFSFLENSVCSKIPAIFVLKFQLSRNTTRVIMEISEISHHIIPFLIYNPLICMQYVLNLKFSLHKIN